MRDPLAVTDARLIDPQGTVYPASEINRDRTSYRGDDGVQPSMGVGVAGGSGGGVSSGVGIGIGIPLFSGGGSSDITESRVAFRLPDAAAYRATWQQWKIHLELAGDGGSRSMEVQPPAPPPE